MYMPPDVSGMNQTIFINHGVSPSPLIYSIQDEYMIAIICDFVLIVSVVMNAYIVII